MNSGIWAIMLLPLGLGLFSLVYATSQGYWFERRCERVWKKTCCGLEGFKGTARSYRFGLVGAFILGDTKTIYPKLREVHGTHEAWTGIVTPFAGQTIEEYNEQKHTRAFALSFNVRFVSFERTDRDWFECVVGRCKCLSHTSFQLSKRRCQCRRMRGTLTGCCGRYQWRNGLMAVRGTCQ